MTKSGAKFILEGMQHQLSKMIELIDSTSKFHLEYDEDDNETYEELNLFVSEKIEKLNYDIYELMQSLKK